MRLKHRFLLVFRNISNFRLQWQMARFLRALGHETDFLYEGADDETFRIFNEQARDHPVRMVPFETYLSEACTQANVHLPLRLTALDQVARFSGPQKYLVFKQLHGRMVNAASKVLRELSPTALIVNEDSISGPLAIIAAARDLGIKVLDVPYGFFARSEFDVDLARKAAAGDLRMAQGMTGLAVRWFAPQWVKRGKFDGALMFPPQYIAAAEVMGISVRDAWSVHGGLSDRVCAEAPKAVELYRNDGLPEEKIVLTGSPYCDVMVHALKTDEVALTALRIDRTIEPGQVRVLVSWPPSYHDGHPGKNEFPSYEEMTRAVLGFLRDLPGCKLTVSLHPAIPAEIRKLVEDHGNRVSDEYVIGLIPKHDIFVTYFSSTIRWATAAGKPVVNYDAYKLGLKLFNSGGFFNEASFASFQARMRELVGSADAYREAARRQIAEADDWGILDGRCTERIVGVLDELTG